MARFIRIKDDRVINIQYIQDLIINSEDDTELIIYNSNGDKILEKYDTAQEAEDAYDSYKSKLKESSGGGAQLQEKSVSITNNGSSVVLPDQDYDGMSKVNIDVNVGGITPTGTLSVTQNGTYDVTNYASADVNVESSTVVITNGTKFSNSQFTELPEWLTNADWSQLTDASLLFNYCTKLVEVNLDLADFFSNANNTSNMFYGGYVLETITFGDIDRINRSSNLTNYNSMFGSCFVLSNETLNLIMKLLPKLRPTSPSTLKDFGISSTQATTCQTLSNYQDFLDAGWTTGY